MTIVFNSLAVVFMLAMTYLCFIVCRADRLSERISKNWDFYKNRLRLHGLILEKLPGSRDDAPCDAMYKIFSERVRIIGGPIKTFRIIRKVMNGSITDEKLESLSVWESSKLPV